MDVQGVAGYMVLLCPAEITMQFKLQLIYFDLLCCLYVFVQELPSPILDDVAIHKPVEQPRLSCEPSDSLDAMKIAWRYQNLPKVQVISC